MLLLEAAFNSGPRFAKAFQHLSDNRVERCRIGKANAYETGSPRLDISSSFDSLAHDVENVLNILLKGSPNLSENYSASFPLE